MSMHSLYPLLALPAVIAFTTILLRYIRIDSNVRTNVLSVYSDWPIPTGTRPGSWICRIPRNDSHSGSLMATPPSTSSVMFQHCCEHCARNLRRSNRSCEMCKGPLLITFCTASFHLPYDRGLDVFALQRRLAQLGIRTGAAA